MMKRNLQQESLASLRKHRSRAFQIILVSFMLNFLVYPAAGTVRINEILASSNNLVPDPDYVQFSDWIELYNPGPDAIDLSGYSLTDDLAQPAKWQVPQGTTIAANGYLVIWADGMNAEVRALHTSFKLNNDGEFVGLFDNNGVVCDTVAFGKQVADVSMGRDLNLADTWRYYETPTPGSTNGTAGLAANTLSGSPAISLSSGLYSGPQIVTITAPATATIRYTTDGSTPTRASSLYSGSLSFSHTTLLKVRGFEPDLLPGPVEIRTYFVDEQTTLPVIALSADPENLWSTDTGIYVDRDIASRKLWERPGFIEFFETDGSRGFAREADIRLFGRTAIYIPEKSLSFFLSNALDYPLFQDIDVRQFESFLLRSSSDDWHLTMFRDAFIQKFISRTLSLDTQASRPAVLFINGAYWGIHNIREKYNEDYLSNHRGVGRNDLDLLYIDFRADNVEILAGDMVHYDALSDFFSNNDLGTEANYRTVAEMVDIDNFIDYVIAETFTGNTSWAHNIRAWRPRTEGGKWQWLIFDLDRGFRTITFDAIADMASRFPLFKSLLQNAEFRTRFLNRYVELLNAEFVPEEVAAILDTMQAGIADEMPRHIERWAGVCGNNVCGIPSMDAWQQSVTEMRNIVFARPGIVRDQLRQIFGLGGDVTLDVRVEQEGNGRVLLGNKTAITKTYSGIFFQDMTIELSAQPEEDARFVAYVDDENGATVSSDPNLSLQLTNSRSLRAIFEMKAPTELPSEISGDMTLTAENAPYVASATVTISRNVTLNIEAGVDISMAADASFIVNGALIVAGSEDQPVGFHGIDNQSWGALCFENATGQSVLSHLELDGTTTGPDVAKYKAAISALQSDIRLDNLAIVNALQPVYADGGTIIMTNSSLDGTGAGDDIVSVKNAIARIENCHLYGNGELDFDFVDGGIIRENRIDIISTNSNRDGIDIGSSINVLIENNQVLDCPDKGVSIGEGSSAIVRGNLIVNTAMGVAVKDNSTATIERNTFYNDSVGVACYEKTAGQGGGTAEVRNCIFAGTFVAEFSLDAKSNAESGYCLSVLNQLDGIGHVKADPLFVSEAMSNFNLQKDSPCINAGDPASARDPDSTRADIGAFAFHFGPQHTAGLYINELMAANTNSFADNAGEYDDWLEIFNAGPVVINVGGLYLTDDMANPTRWQFPGNDPEATTIRPGEHLVVWADEDLAQGDLHCDFKLDAAGESVVLLKLDNDVITVVDSVSFGEQVDGFSYGRVHDGDPSWQAFSNPTPGWENDSVSTQTPSDPPGLPEDFIVHQNYPNPFNPATTIMYELPEARNVAVDIYNSVGQRISRLLVADQAAGPHKITWNGTDEYGALVSSGLYFYKVTAGKNSVFRKMLLLR